MDQSKYERIKAAYGRFSSWAIWGDFKVNNIGETLIQSSIDTLHANYIIIGFNASQNLTGNWMNFHMPHQGGRDTWLAELFNQNPYRGAYMTDLIKIEENDGSLNFEKSGEIERRFFQPENNSDLIKSRIQKKKLAEEMALLGANERTIFILIGDLVARYFDCLTDFKYESKYRLPHYAGRFAKKEWLRRCREILSED